MAAAKRATTSDTHGQCKFCPETWDPGTDIRGWHLNKATRRWDVCPSCNRYKKHVAEAWEHDRHRYWSWFSCKCGAFTQEIYQWRDHKNDCPSYGKGNYFPTEAA